MSFVSLCILFHILQHCRLLLLPSPMGVLPAPPLPYLETWSRKCFDSTGICQRVARVAANSLRFFLPTGQDDKGQQRGTRSSAWDHGRSVSFPKKISHAENTWGISLSGRYNTRISSVQAQSHTLIIRTCSIGGLPQARSQLLRHGLVVPYSCT